MDHREFNEIFGNQVAKCSEVLVRKASEYAEEGGDRLHNFKVAADLQGMTPRQALGGMMAKHVVSVYDLIADPELADMEVWDEKIGDTLNYLFLLKAIVVEEMNNGN